MLYFTRISRHLSAIFLYAKHLLHDLYQLHELLQFAFDYQSREFQRIFALDNLLRLLALLQYPFYSVLKGNCRFYGHRIHFNHDLFQHSSHGKRVLSQYYTED